MEVQATALTLIVIIVLALIYTIVSYFYNKRLDEEYDIGYTSAMSLKKVIKENTEEIQTFVKGIDGVTSVNVSAKRYVQLLKAEEDLLEIRTKLKGINDGEV